MCLAAYGWCRVARWAPEPLRVADESPRHVLSGRLTGGQWHTRICLAHRRSGWSSYRKSYCASGDSLIHFDTTKGMLDICKGIFLAISVAWWPHTKILTHPSYCVWLNENVYTSFAYNTNVTGMWAREFRSKNVKVGILLKHLHENSQKRMFEHLFVVLPTSCSFVHTEGHVKIVIGNQ